MRKAGLHSTANIIEGEERDCSWNDKLARVTNALFLSPWANAARKISPANQACALLLASEWNKNGREGPNAHCYLCVWVPGPRTYIYKCLVPFDCSHENLCFSWSRASQNKSGGANAMRVFFHARRYLIWPTATSHDMHVFIIKKIKWNSRSQRAALFFFHPLTRAYKAVRVIKYFLNKKLLMATGLLAFLIKSH